jgi:protease I
MISSKNIAIVIAFKNFRDEEYFIPKQILGRAGAKITTVSNSIGIAFGVEGGEARVNILLEDLKVEDFDVIIFIGGPGALKYLDNETSYQIVKETVSQNKLLAAICISPVILAKAGVLENKKATVWSNSLDKSAVKILKENGANYEEKSVVVDGNIITGNGPLAAKEFAEEIIKLLTKN